MSFDTEYCNDCGLLHDPEDGKCLGCELVEEKKILKKQNAALAELVKKCGWWLDFASSVTGSIRGESLKFSTDSAKCAKANYKEYKKIVKELEQE